MEPLKIGSNPREYKFSWHIKFGLLAITQKLGMLAKSKKQKAFCVVQNSGFHDCTFAYTRCLQPISK